MTLNDSHSENLLNQLYRIQNIKDRLYELVKILREHCEWDKKQDFQSLKQSLLEETYEVLQGIDEENKEKKIPILKEELGDLLFLIHFYIKLCEEQNYFTIDELYQNTIEKLVTRHPHVFKNLEVKDTKEILRNWEGFKNKPFGTNTEFLPALLRAEKIQKKASLEGFDWQVQKDQTHIKEIIETIKKELNELEKEINTTSSKDSQKHLELELGDVLFSIVNLARHLNLSSEIALHKSIEKFIKRFNKVMEIYNNNDEYKKLDKNKTEILESIYQNIKQSEQ